MSEMSTTVPSPEGISVAPPSNLSVAPDSTQGLSLRWSQGLTGTVPAGYNIYKNGQYIGTVTGEVFNDILWVSGISASYYVVAFSASSFFSVPSITVNVDPNGTPLGLDVGAPSAAVDLASATATAPPAPANLVVSRSGQSGLSLTWTEALSPTALGGFNVYRDGRFLTTVKAPSFVDTTASRQIGHAYDVVAFDLVGNLSPPSATVSVNSQGKVLPADTSPPSVVTGLAIAVSGSSGLLLSWNASTDNVANAGYNVYQDGTYVTTVQTTSYTANNLALGSTHYFDVVAFDASNNYSIPSALIAATVPGAAASPTIDLSQFKLTFNDEFNTFVSSPNGSGGGWATTLWGLRTLAANNETEYYSDSSVGADPFSDQNGILTISASPGSHSGGLSYTSGAITTLGHFYQTFGYFEIRAELPSGAGMWPAFWLTPETGGSPPELDIMEAFGAPNANSEGGAYAYHWAVHSNTISSGSTGAWAAVPADLYTGFHTYGVDWEPNTTTFYFDGEKVSSIATPTDMNVPMAIIANLAVGGSWAGPAAGEAANMQIDYIRAYSHNPAAATPIPVPTITGDVPASQTVASVTSPAQMSFIGAPQQPSGTTFAPASLGIAATDFAPSNPYACTTNTSAVLAATGGAASLYDTITGRSTDMISVRDNSVTAL